MDEVVLEAGSLLPDLEAEVAEFPAKPGQTETS